MRAVFHALKIASAVAAGRYEVEAVQNESHFGTGRLSSGILPQQLRPGN